MTYSVGNNTLNVPKWMSVASIALREAESHLSARTNVEERANTAASRGVLAGHRTASRSTSGATYNLTVDNSSHDWNWGNRKTTVINNNMAPAKKEDTAERKKEKESENNVALFCAAGAALVASCYILGTVIDRCLKGRSTFQETNKLHKEAIAFENSYPAAKGLTSSMLDVQSPVVSRDTCYVVAALAGILGSSALIAGSLAISAAISPILVPTGTVLLVAALATAVFAFARFPSEGDLKSLYGVQMVNAQALLTELSRGAGAGIGSGQGSVYPLVVEIGTAIPEATVISSEFVLGGSEKFPVFGPWATSPFGTAASAPPATLLSEKKEV